MAETPCITAKGMAPQGDWPGMNIDIPARGTTCLVGPQPERVVGYLRVLGGIDPPAVGELLYFGESCGVLNVPDRKALRRKIGYVPHSAPILSVLNGLENVVLPALYHKTMERRDAECAAHLLLAALGCEAELTLLPAYLSPLERTQLAIARAAILEPSVLLLEEPFHSLQLDEHERIAAFIELWSKEHALLLTTRHLRFVKEQAEQIIFAADEEILYFDSWAQFYGSDATPVTDYLRHYTDSYYLE